MTSNATLNAIDQQPRLRSVQPADAPAMSRYLQTLGAASRRQRFHGCVHSGSERLLQHLTGADGRRHIALVAVLPCDDGDLIVGEARCVRGAEGEPAEMAISVAEAWQGRGLAVTLLRGMLAAAAAAGVSQVTGDVLAGNARMMAFMRREGFAPDGAEEPGVVRWTRELAPVPACGPRQVCRAALALLLRRVSGTARRRGVVSGA